MARLADGLGRRNSASALSQQIVWPATIRRCHSYLITTCDSPPHSDRRRTRRSPRHSAKRLSELTGLSLYPLDLIQFRPGGVIGIAGAGDLGIRGHWVNVRAAKDQRGGVQRYGDAMFNGTNS